MKKLINLHLYFISFIQKCIFNKKIIAIKYSFKSNVESFLITNLKNYLNKYSEYFAIKISEDSWYGSYNKFVCLTLLVGKENDYIPYSEHQNYIFVNENHNQSEDLKTSKYNKFFDDTFQKENLEEIANKIIKAYKDFEWADYNDRLQSHHFFAGSL